MKPTILGVIDPGFLNQVPTLGFNGNWPRCPSQPPFTNSKTLSPRQQRHFVSSQGVGIRDMDEAPTPNLSQNPQDKRASQKLHQKMPQPKLSSLTPSSCLLIPFDNTLSQVGGFARCERHGEDHDRLLATGEQQASGVLAGPVTLNFKPVNIGALIIRIGFWGPLYYNYNKEPPKMVLEIIKALYYPELHLSIISQVVGRLRAVVFVVENLG